MALPQLTQGQGSYTADQLNALLDIFPGAYTSWQESVAGAKHSLNFGEWLDLFKKDNGSSDYFTFLNDYASQGRDAALKKWAYRDPDGATTYEGGNSASTAAGESYLIDRITNDYVIPEMDKDKERQAVAGQLSREAVDGYDNATNAIRKIYSQKNWDKYLTDNPDVASWAKDKVANGEFKTVEDAARNHYETYGRAEGRKLDETQGEYLTTELAASDTATKEQQANLDAQVKARDQALKDYLASSNSNLKSQLSDYDTALKNELSAKDTALKNELSTKGAALKDELSTKGTALDTAHDYRLSNVDTLAKSSLGNLDGQTAAYRAGFDKFSTGERSAQAAVDARRIAGAKNQQSAVNLGLQSSLDNIRAQSAADGYLGGGSSGSDMAMARAAIGARQEAAGAMSGAKLSNATDGRSLQTRLGAMDYGITTQDADARRGILDTQANNIFGVNNGYATDRLNLSNYGAEQNRSLANYGADQNRSLANYGADQNRSLANYGADQRRTIADTGAASTQELANYGADSTQQINDAASGRKLSITTDDIKRQIAAAPLQTAITNAKIEALKNADDYATTGAKNGLNLLGWFKSSAQTPSYATTSVQANTALGDAWGSIGAGIANLGQNIGLAKLTQVWGKAPAKTPAAPTPTG